ncbi:MAG: tetratricopeptide repeat protein [Bacteroidota bacterium]
MKADGKIHVNDFTSMINLLKISVLFTLVLGFTQCAEKAPIEGHEKGQQLFEAGKLNEAYDELSKAMRTGGPSYFKSYYRGLVNFKMRKNQAAIADFNQAIQLDPEHPGAYFSLGYTYHAIRADDQAMDYYNQAIERLDLEQLKEEFRVVAAKSYFNRGILFGGQKKFNEAILDYTKSIEIDPNFGDSYYRRGVFRLVLSEGQQGCDDVLIGMQKGSADHYQVGKECQK